MKKSVSILLILAMLLGVLTACAQTTAPAETTETKTETTEPAPETTEADATEAETEAAAEEAEQEAEETDRLYIAAVAAEVGIPYFTTMQWGAMDAAKDYNVELYWTGPAEWDFSKQQTFIDGVMATNPDALMLVPTDNSALVTYVDTWMKEGTPVICTDLFLMEPVDLVGYSSDPYSGGAEAAKIFFEQNGEGGVYQPVGTNPGAYGANLRVQGFVETMQSLDPSCKILDTLYPSNDANKAAQLVSAALTGNPDMSGRTGFFVFSLHYR